LDLKIFNLKNQKIEFKEFQFKESKNRFKEMGYKEFSKLYKDLIFNFWIKILDKKIMVPKKFSYEFVEIFFQNLIL